MRWNPVCSLFAMELDSSARCSSERKRGAPTGTWPCMGAHERPDPKTLMKEGTDGGLGHKGLILAGVRGPEGVMVEQCI